MMRRTGKPFILIIVFFELVVLYAPTIKWLFSRWTMSVWHHTHGLILPPVIFYLIRNKLRALRQLPIQSSVWGFLVLVPALLLHVLDTGMHTQLLSAISLVLSLLGLSLLFLGIERSKEIGFPLFFLFFALPIPLVLTEQIHLLLRKITTANIAYTIPYFGIPIFTEGTTIFLPNSTLLVSDACSGFSTLYAVAAFACITAYMTPNRRQGVLALIAIIPVAIAANTARVISLVLLKHWGGGDILETFLHPLSGVAALILGISIIYLFGDRHVYSGNFYHFLVSSMTQPAHNRGNLISTRYGRVVVVLIAFVLFPTIIHTYIGLTERDGLVASAIGLSLADLDSKPTSGDIYLIKKAFASHDWIERNYSQAGGPSLKLLVARSYNHKRLYHHPENRLENLIFRGLDNVGTKSVSDQPDIPFHLLKSSNGSGRDTVVYSLLYDDFFIDNPFQFLIRNAWSSLFHRRKPMTLFFVHDPSSISGTPLSKSRAVRLLLEAIDDFRSQRPV
ncbi:MAG: exosortase/archaeosortase family protein [Nitrospiria bacterium]